MTPVILVSEPSAYLDGGCAHAVAVQVDVALEHQAAVGGFLTSRNDISSGRHVHLPPPAAAAALIAFCIAAVSSVMPSPLAPKFCTLKIMSLSPYQAKTSVVPIFNRQLRLYDPTERKSCDRISGKRQEKQNQLISGYEMFRKNNVLLTLARVARSQWTSQGVGAKLGGRCLEDPGRFKWVLRLRVDRNASQPMTLMFERQLRFLGMELPIREFHR